MNSKEQARFDALYQQHLAQLKLQGLAPATRSISEAVLSFRNSGARLRGVFNRV